MGLTADPQDVLSAVENDLDERGGERWVELTGQVLLALLVVGTVLIPLIAVVSWSRVRGPRWVRFSQRLTLVVVAQGAAVMLAFTAVNDQYLFFASWADLLGEPVPPPAIVTLTTTQRSATAPAPVGGRLIEYDLHGPASGLTDPVLVHLPPQYDQPAYAAHHFPVVEFLAGWHDYPQSWIQSLHLFTVLDRLQREGAVRPFISVLPTVNVALPRDTECTNVPDSTRALTWLTTDVPQLVASHYRSLPPGPGWGAVGYSTGGYCAAKLAFLDPGRFHTAVVMSGYFNALKDDTTGDLWHHSQEFRDHNDLLWLTRHGLEPAANLLVFTSREDPDSYGSTREFLRASRPPATTAEMVASRGAHNYNDIRLTLPRVLIWLSQHLGGDRLA